MKSTGKSAAPQIPLPSSVEDAYRKKCIDLKKRLIECEDWNELLVVRNERLRRGVQRLRLERALLLREIERRTEPRVDDSDGSPSPPPTPMRLKRPKRDAPSYNVLERHDSPPASPSNSAFGPKFTSVNPTPAEAAQSSPLAVPGRKAGSRPTIPRSSGSRHHLIPKPKNAYMIFCDQEREGFVQTANPEDENELDIHKRLAQAWQHLGPEGQEPYYLEFDTQMAKYKQAMSEFKAEEAKKKESKKSFGNGEGRAPQEGTDDEGSPVSEDTDQIAQNTDNETASKGSKTVAGVGSGGGFTAVNSSRSNFL